MRADAEYRGYRDALRRHVCAVCLDADDDNRCTLRDGPCAMDEHLMALVQGVLESLDRHDTRYAAVVQQRVCTRCRHAGAEGACALREKDRCALSTYLPLVIETIRRGPSAA